MPTDQHYPLLSKIDSPADLRRLPETQLVPLAAELRQFLIQTVSQMGGSGEKGVILTLAPSAVEQGEAAARIAARLLNGESPASIAPEMPKLIELVLNLKEAGAMGLKPSMDLISDATRVIK